MDHEMEPASRVPWKHVVLPIFILQENVLTSHKIEIYIQILIFEENVHQFTSLLLEIIHFSFVSPICF